MQDTSSPVCLKNSITKVLYACISPVKSDFMGSELLPVFSSQENWKKLFKIAEQHKILPQLYQFFLKIDSATVAPELISELHRYHNHRRKRNLLCTYELGRLVRILKENKIHAVAFKGPTLSKIAYNSLDARSFTDLDILVRQDDYFKVREVLKCHGYQPFGELQKSEEEEKKFCLQAGEYTLFKENGTLYADIHYRCLGGNNIAFSSDFSFFWERLESVSLAGTEVLVFSKTDTLIYLCMNGIKDGWSSLRHICDIAMFISNSPNLNWDDVSDSSQKLRLQTAVSLSLSLVEILTGVSTPISLSKCPKQKEKIDFFSRYIARKITTNLETAESISLIDELRMRFFILEGRMSRIKYIKSLIYRPFFLLFAINTFDKEYIDLPAYLSFLYYPVRLIRVISQYKKSTLKFLIK